MDISVDVLRVKIKIRGREFHFREATVGVVQKVTAAENDYDKLDLLEAFDDAEKMAAKSKSWAAWCKAAFEEEGAAEHLEFGKITLPEIAEIRKSFFGAASGTLKSNGSSQPSGPSAPSPTASGSPRATK